MSNKTKCTDDSLRLRDALKQLNGKEERTKRNVRLREALKTLTVEGKHSESYLYTTVRNCTLAGSLILAIVLVSLWITG